MTRLKRLREDNHRRHNGTSWNCCDNDKERCLMEKAGAYYKLAREVEKYSHPLVQFHVRDVHDRYDDGLLHINQLLTIDIYRLGQRVGYKLLAAEVAELWDFDNLVQSTLHQLLRAWVLDSLRRGKELNG